MAIDPGGAFEVALYNNDFFTNASNDDLQIRTMLERQRILIGTRSNADAALMITSNTVMMNNNLFIYSKLGVGKSNLDTYPVDIVGNTAIDGSVNMTKHILCRGMQLRRKTGSYFSTSNLPTGLVQGFSNDSIDTANGLTFYISSNTPTNYFRYVSAGNEIARFTGDGNFGIGLSNPDYKLHVQGDALINSNLYIAGHILPQQDMQYDLGSSNMRFRDLHLSSNTIYIGSSKIRSTQSGGIALLDANDTPAPTVSSKLSLSNYGEIVLYTSNNNLGISLSNPSSILEVGGTDAILIPKGSTLQRPSQPKRGHMRYNTNTDTFEGYGAGNTWGSLGGVKDTNQDTFISAESFPSSNDDILRFYNSNNETMRVTANGRIGISNQDPSERFELSGGNAKFNSNIYVVHKMSVGSSNPKETLDITGNIMTSQNIYSLGSIGIGTSNPSTQLDVNGSVKVNSNLEVIGDLTIRGATTTVESTTVNITDNIIRINNGATYTSSLLAGLEINRGTGYSNYNLLFDETTQFFKVGQSGQLQTVATRDDTPSSNTIAVYDINNNKFTGCNDFVYRAGNVGIGTSNPSNKLHVQNGAMFISDNRVGQRPSMSLQCSNLPLFNIQHSNEGSGIIENNGNNIALYAFSNIYFYSKDGGSNTERMRIQTSTGNLGIGTTTPHTQARLHIAGDGTQNQVQFSVLNGALDNKNWAMGPNGNTFYMYTLNDANNSTTDWLRVTRNTMSISNVCIPNGNVGIGNTNPFTRLHLTTTAAGTVVPMLTLQNNGGGNLTAGACIDFTTYNTSNTQARIHCLDENFSGHIIFSTKVPGSDTNALTERVRITNGGNFGIGTSNPGYKLEVSGAIYATGDITAMSDRRYKNNIIPLQGALSKVDQITSYYYNRIDDTNGKRNIGFIAQELEEVVPEVVTYDKMNDKYGVNYGNMTALLLSAMKEMRQEYTDKINQLQGIIRIQKEKIDILMKDAEVLIFK